MPKLNFAEAVAEVVRQDPRYDADAYQFVREGLDFTLKLQKKEKRAGMHHVSGQELLEGLRQHALNQFGPMTKTVLEHWGIQKCEDFGEIVFNMVEKGILGKNEQDSREDFKGGYNFEDAFVKPYRPARLPHSGRSASHTRHSDRHPDSRHGSDVKKLSSGSN